MVLQSEISSVFIFANSTHSDPPVKFTTIGNSKLTKFFLLIYKASVMNHELDTLWNCQWFLMTQKYLDAKNICFECSITQHYGVTHVSFLFSTWNTWPKWIIKSGESIEGKTAIYAIYMFYSMDKLYVNCNLCIQFVNFQILTKFWIISPC